MQHAQDIVFPIEGRLTPEEVSVLCILACQSAQDARCSGRGGATFNTALFDLKVCPPPFCLEQQAIVAIDVHTEGVLRAALHVTFDPALLCNDGRSKTVEGNVADEPLLEKVVDVLA